MCFQNEALILNMFLNVFWTNMFLPKNQAWHTANMHELGIINAPEFILGKQLWKKGYVSD